VKRCAIIYNPVSGRGIFKKKINYVVNRIEKQGYTVECFATERSKHAIDLVKEVCSKSLDLLVVAGGDGTLHECINGYDKSTYKPPIGYLPSGTACDVGRTLKIPKRIDFALDIIFNGHTVKMDYVESNQGIFSYVAAIGTYVDIPYVTESKLKKRIGYLAYLITGIKEFFTIPIIKAKITNDDGEFKGLYSLILIVNSRHVAGLNIVKKPVLDDGLVDVVLFKYIPFFNNLLYFISFIIGPKVLPGVKKFKTSKLSIETEKLHTWNMDGEKANQDHLNLIVKKQTFEIYANERIIDKYFKEQA